jgi:hypothetical protein
LVIRSFEKVGFALYLDALNLGKYNTHPCYGSVLFVLFPVVCMNRAWGLGFVSAHRLKERT